MRVIYAIAWVGLAVSVSSSEKLPLAFLKRYCLDCHDADKAKGEFNLERLLDAEISAHAGKWETFIRRLAARQMPPSKRKLQPSGEFRCRLQSDFADLNSSP